MWSKPCSCEGSHQETLLSLLFLSRLHLATLLAGGCRWVNHGEDAVPARQVLQRRRDNPRLRCYLLFEMRDPRMHLLESGVLVENAGKEIDVLAVVVRNAMSTSRE
ncbi:MAG: hypothetical protein NVSMB22_09220 [Chloroflexota bacterium]